MTQNDERGRSPVAGSQAITEGDARAARVSEMSTAEFREWVKTLDAQERWMWRDYRRKLSKDRYERERLATLASPQELAEQWINLQHPLTKEDLMKLTLEEVISLDLPPEVLTEVVTELRRQRKRESWRRWREAHKEEQAERLREQWERLKADPVRYAEYKAKKAEAMRRKRKEAKRGDE